MGSSKSSLWETLSRHESLLGNQGLVNSAVFLTLLRHERYRTDRGGNEFSLVVFEVNGARPRNGKLALVSARMKEEMRSIDEVGWLDQTTIGALLPATKREGGRSFAKRVLQRMPSGMTFPFKIFTYPGNWLPQVESEGSENGKAQKPSAADSPSRAAQMNRRVGARADVGNIFYPKIPSWKRALDFGGALLGLIVLSPLMLLLAVYIKTVSRGPAFFKQERLGRGGKAFTFLKFRTMKTNNNESYHKNHIIAAIHGDSTLDKLDDRGDPRIIPGGRILRRACLDELPQLVNVLRGEMSLVGPRPCLAYEAREFLRWHTHRFDIVPGLTGLWQVSGKNKLTFSQMIRLDISYAEHMSLWLDLKIILMTLPAIAKMLLESLSNRMTGLSRINTINDKPDVKVVPS